MAQLGKDNRTEKLSFIFEKVLINYEFLESTDLSTTDPEYQQRVSESITEAEKAVHMVNILHLFSDNEDIDEVSTSSIKFMLLPGLLGYFTMKKIEGERLEIVKKGKAYFKDFMRLCSLYNLTAIKLEHGEDDEEKETNSKEVTNSSDVKRELDLLEMSNQRQNKIQRYKQQKQTLAEIKELRPYVEKSHVEEEVQRKYYLLLLKHWISTTIDEYTNIKVELQILEQMGHMTAQDTRVDEVTKKESSQKKVFRPFIITKDQLQKKVLGAGYPSLPTLTIEEFYEQKIKEGTLQLPSGQNLQNWATDPEKTTKEAEEDDKTDKDNPAKLAKARVWDDWKDDVRRGDGNRTNMG